MKLNQNTLINVVQRETYINSHVEYMLKQKESDSPNEVDYHNRNILMFKRTDFRRLILSKKTKDNLSYYKIPKDVRYGVLRSLPNRFDGILVDENTLMRYIKTDDNIVVIFDLYDIETNEIVNKIFHFDLINESMILGMVEDEQSLSSDGHASQSTYNKFIEEYFSMFMIVVTYLELTPTTLEVVEGGRSTGTRKTFKLKNETDKSVIVVQTNWNEEKINLRDIDVRGHYRLQPYGVGRSQYKFIYIQPFKKGITRRLPQKELV